MPTVRSGCPGSVLRSYTDRLRSAECRRAREETDRQTGAGLCERKSAFVLFSTLSHPILGNATFSPPPPTGESASIGCDTCFVRPIDVGGRPGTRPKGLAQKEKGGA